MQASADAAGAAAAAASGKLRLVSAFILTSFFHLEAGLVVLGSGLLGRFGIRWRGIPLVMGAIACLAQWHLQVRYLLPGAAMLAVRR